MHAFCLRAVGESLEAVARLIPVTAGFAAAGRILDDVSFINASGLVERTAIRRAGRPSLAFFERPEWMAAWFPGHHAEVIALCREHLELAPPQAVVTNSGVANAVTSNGRVLLSFLADPAQVTARSSDGSVEVVVPRDDTAYKVDAATSDGRRTVDVNTSQDVTRTIFAHTSNGSVRVLRAAS